MNYNTEYIGKSVLITGGIGFIGSNLALKLVELGAKVTLVDSLIPEYGGNLANIDAISRLVRVNIADVRDEHSLKYLVRDQDYLFNLAGQTSHMDSMSNPNTDLEINCKAQLTLLEACRAFNKGVKIVFASTRQVYGRPDYLPVTEAHPIRPVDVNGINKMAGEWYHTLYASVYGIHACALRLTNTYGPRMRIKDARQTFVGIWIRSLIEGKAFEVWGGEQLRDFNYVDDCVEALLVAAIVPSTKGRVFNLGHSSPVSLCELAKLMVSINGGGVYVTREFPAERKRIDIGDYYSDHTLFTSVTGWTPKTSLEDGLAMTLRYFKEKLPLYL